MFKKKKKLLGLDVGTFSVSAVEMAWTDGGPQVTQCAYAEIPDENARGDVLRNLVTENKLKGARTALAVSGRTVIVRYVPMPQMSLPELKKAIRFEAGKYIPFGLDEYTVDCEIVTPAGGGDNQMKVVLVAVKSSQITDRVELVKSVGLIPAVVDVDGFALCNVAADRLAAPLAEGQVIAVLDLGHTKTNVAILNGTTGFFTREFYVSGSELSDQLGQALSVDPFELEKLKREPGQRLPEIRQATQTTIDDMVNEIKLSFDFFENEVDRSIDRVYLTGGASRFEPLVQSLAESLDAPIESWSPTEGLTIATDGPGADMLHKRPELFSVALGLAGRAAPTDKGSTKAVSAPTASDEADTPADEPAPEPVTAGAETQTRGREEGASLEEVLPAKPAPPPSSGSELDDVLPAKPQPSSPPSPFDQAMPPKPPTVPDGNNEPPKITGDDFGTTQS
jgi:type IV pilus assembly protein PilM